jgi:hypothetical protein
MAEQRVAAGVILPCLLALRYLHAKVNSQAVSASHVDSARMKALTSLKTCNVGAPAGAVRLQQGRTV